MIPAHDYEGVLLLLKDIELDTDLEEVGRFLKRDVETFRVALRLALVAEEMAEALKMCADQLGKTQNIMFGPDNTRYVFSALEALEAYEAIKKEG